MQNTELKATLINLVSLIEKHATNKTLVDIKNGIVDRDIQGSMELVKFAMDCFYANKQPFDIVIINNSNTYGLVQTNQVQEYLELGLVRRWDK